MNIILFFIITIFIIVFLFIVFIYISSVFNSIKYWVPQVWTFGSDIEVMKKWLEKYNLKWKKIIDLWSGTWKSIRFFEKYFWAKTTWYEIDFGNYLVSLLLNKIYWLNANIKRSDFKNANLVDYDFIYIYLFPKIMERIKTFIFSKSNKWTIIFSNAFLFKDKIPIEILKNSNWKEELYVYKV